VATEIDKNIYRMYILIYLSGVNILDHIWSKVNIIYITKVKFMSKKNVSFIFYTFNCFSFYFIFFNTYTCDLPILYFVDVKWMYQILIINSMIKIQFSKLTIIKITIFKTHCPQKSHQLSYNIYRKKIADQLTW